MSLRIFFSCTAICLLTITNVRAQEAVSATAEPLVPVAQAAVALDSNGNRSLEATLRTTGLNGAPDTPVTNTRIVLKNVSQQFYSFVSGVVTFYDGSGVRCGEGLFKADAFAPNELVETDTPGIRITCTPASWRIVATNLLPRYPQATALTGQPIVGAANMVISIDGEEHPIQLNKPMVLNLGEKQRTIVVRTAP